MAAVTVDSGTRIRIHQGRDHGNRTLTGTVLSADSGAITLRLDRNDDFAPSPRFAALSPAPRDTVLEVPRSTIERLELSAGKTSNAKTGLIVGAAMGGAVGLVVGLATQCSVAESYACNDSPGSFLAVTTVSALAGGGIGLLIGAMGSHERWKNAAGELAVRPLILPGGGRTRIGLAIALPAMRK
ncbi:MAG TPA: hypothetical protein VJN95_17890 [Gemmatimonadales bacterium]|nr:hypothetical protein [Gemmatimonadales bacterium]